MLRLLAGLLPAEFLFCPETSLTSVVEQWVLLSVIKCLSVGHRGRRYYGPPWREPLAVKGSVVVVVVVLI